MSRILLAPDKFKGSLTAQQVCAALTEGLLAARPGLEVVSVPVADGGDGTVDAALSAGFERIEVTAQGPTGEPVATAYAWRDGVAVLELADVSGLRRLPGGELAALTASSWGTGEVVAHALDRGATRVVLGVGGSASTDGGAGMVQALGVALLPERHDGWRGGAALVDLAGLDLSGLRVRDAELVVACDVDNPLLGPKGAAAVYGPQKGARPEDVHALEAGLTRWADVVRTATGTDDSDVPGAGAAGGVAFGAVSLLGARLAPGIDLFLDLVGMDTALAGVELVVTGEGSLDEQTLHGKAPAGVAARARAAGIPVVAVAGRSLLHPSMLQAAGFVAAYALADVEPDPTRSMTHAAELLRRLAPQLLDHLPVTSPGRTR